MFGIGGTELLIVAVFALLIFGPDKLPQMAKTAGRALRQFNKAKDDVEATIKREMFYEETKEIREKLTGPSSPFGEAGTDQKPAPVASSATEFLDDEEDEEEE